MKSSMQIRINDELRKYIDPLTESERATLERSLLAEGCRDALVLWEDVLVDGHNRYDICQKHGIPYKVTQNTSFQSMEDVMLWMIENHLGRRSVSDFQRGVLALRQKDILAKRALQEAERAKAEDAAIAPPDPDKEPEPAPKPRTSREDIARAARLSSNTISQIEKIQKTATPELVDAIRQGTISINAAATVASLPESEQVAAVAGGKELLRKAAKEIREQRAASRPPRVPKHASDESGEPLDEVGQLRLEVSQLKEKNAALRAENAELRERISALVDAS
jgi:transcriptional regulator with XRE-family HTH domain